VRFLPARTRWQHQTAFYDRHSFIPHTAATHFFQPLELILHLAMRVCMLCEARACGSLAQALASEKMQITIDSTIFAIGKRLANEEQCERMLVAIAMCACDASGDNCDANSSFVRC
jgi:hypothetical protein